MKVQPSGRLCADSRLLSHTRQRPAATVRQPCRFGGVVGQARPSPRHYHPQLTASEWALKCPSGLRRPGLQNTSFVWLPAAVKQNAAFCIIAYGTAPGSGL